MTNKTIEKYFIKFNGFELEIHVDSIYNAITYIKEQYPNQGIKTLIVRQYEVLDNERELLVDTAYE